MNQRILELAKEAGLKFPSETALSPPEQKFVELIVRECSGPMIRLARERDQSGEWKNYPVEVMAMFMWGEIQQHFGI